MKKITLAFVTVLACSVLFNSTNAYSCSSVFLNNDKVKLIGRNMDWPKGDGVVEINARNVKKQAQMIVDDSKPMEWTSIYGSVTFDLVQEVKGLGKMAASACGLNEKGLWIGSLWVLTPPDIKYPPKDKRPTLNNWEFEQYVLDNFKNVEDVIKNLPKVRISGFKADEDLLVELHWFIADETGDSAIIEFPNGKLTIHRNPGPRVMTNSFYEHGQEYLKEYEGFGGKKTIPDLSKTKQNSENRYVVASYLLKEAEKTKDPSINTVFDIMKGVNQTGAKNVRTSNSLTQWTMVYDLKAKQIKWNTRLNPKIRTINLSEVDFSPTRQVFNINNWYMKDFRRLEKVLTSF